MLPDPTPAVSWAALARGFPLLVGVRGWEDNGVATFRRCTGVGQVASLRRWLDICVGGVRSLRTWPRAVLAQAVQQLALGLGDDAYDASPGLTYTTRSWFPTALLLAVAVTARAWAARRTAEATFCRELRTLRLWKARPGRILLAEQQVLSIGPPNAAQLHRRPRVAPERHNPAAGSRRRNHHHCFPLWPASPNSNLRAQLSSIRTASASCLWTTSQIARLRTRYLPRFPILRAGTIRTRKKLVCRREALPDSFHRGASGQLAEPCGQLHQVGCGRQPTEDVLAARTLRPLLDLSAQRRHHLRHLIGLFGLELF